MAARRPRGPQTTGSVGRRLLGVGITAVALLTACTNGSPPAGDLESSESVTAEIEAFNDGVQVRLDSPATYQDLPRCIDLAGTVTEGGNAVAWVGFRPAGDPGHPYGIYPTMPVGAERWKLPGLVLGAPTDPGRVFEVVLFALPRDLSTFLAGTVLPGFDTAPRDGRYVDWGRLPPGIADAPSALFQRGAGSDNGCGG